MPGDSSLNCSLLFSAALHSGFMNSITESKPSNQCSRYVGPFLLDRDAIDNKISAGN